MTFWLHVILQCLAILVKALFERYGVTADPETGQFLGMIPQAIAVALGLSNHFFNPDGTPAEACWLRSRFRSWWDR